MARGQPAAMIRPGNVRRPARPPSPLPSRGRSGASRAGHGSPSTPSRPAPCPPAAPPRRRPSRAVGTSIPPSAADYSLARPGRPAAVERRHMDWIRSILGVGLVRNLRHRLVHAAGSRGRASGAPPTSGSSPARSPTGRCSPRWEGSPRRASPREGRSRTRWWSRCSSRSAGTIHPWIEPGTNPRWLDFSAVALMAPAAAFAGWARARIGSQIASATR